MVASKITEVTGVSLELSNEDINLLINILNAWVSMHRKSYWPDPGGVVFCENIVNLIKRAMEK